MQTYTKSYHVFQFHLGFFFFFGRKSIAYILRWIGLKDSIKLHTILCACVLYYLLSWHIVFIDFHRKIVEIEGKFYGDLYIIFGV